MKKYFILLSIYVYCVQALYSQRQTATFEDGTKVDYEIVDNHTDNMNRTNLYIGNWADDVYTFLSASYFLPDVFFAKIKYGGGTHLGVDGLYFLLSKEKSKNQKLVVKSEYASFDTKIKYVTKIEIIRKTYYGIHGGVAYKNYSISSGSGLVYQEGFSTIEVAIGVGMTRGKYVRTIIESRRKPMKIRGTTQLSIYGDLLFYPVRNLDNEQTSAGETIDDISSAFGYRVYLDGRTSFWGKGDWGLMYQIGVGNGTLGFYPVLGFGVFIGFKQFN